jgi:hypothetical protein
MLRRRAISLIELVSRQRKIGHIVGYFILSVPLHACELRVLPEFAVRAPPKRASGESFSPLTKDLHGSRQLLPWDFFLFVRYSGGSRETFKRRKRLVYPTFWFLPSHLADAPSVPILDPVLRVQVLNMTDSILETISSEFASAAENKRTRLPHGDMLLPHFGSNLEMTDRYNRTRRHHWQK